MPREGPREKACVCAVLVFVSGLLRDLGVDLLDEGPWGGL